MGQQPGLRTCHSGTYRSTLPQRAGSNRSLALYAQGEAYQNQGEKKMSDAGGHEGQVIHLREKKRYFR